MDGWASADAIEGRGRKVPKGHPLTDEQRERIYDLHTMNVRHEDIADQFGINVGTVNRCVGRQRKLHQEKKEH